LVEREMMVKWRTMGKVVMLHLEGRLYIWGLRYEVGVVGKARKQRLRWSGSLTVRLVVFLVKGQKSGHSIWNVKVHATTL
jgi:hypothetical protein